MGRRGPQPPPRPDWTPPPAAAEAWERWQRPGVHRAQRVMAWCESMPVTTGRLAGRAIRLRPFQRDVIRSLYGRGRKGRLARLGVVSTPRKNGKTGLGALLGLAHLCGPESVPHGELVSAANDRDQASIIWRAMVSIIESVPALRERIEVQRHQRVLEDMVTGSSHRVLSAIGSTKHGLSPTWAVYDELGQATSRSLWDALRTSTGAHEESMLLVLSTRPGSPDPGHPMAELLAYGEQLDAGTLEDPDVRVLTWGAAEDDDPWDRRVWRRANPGLGSIRSLAELEAAARQARAIPSQEPPFRRFLLNQRLAGGSEYQWVRRETWMAGQSEGCFGGGGPLAAAAVDWVPASYLALVAVARADDCTPPGWAVRAWIWAPADRIDALERRDAMQPHYGRWARDGTLGAPPGQVIGDRAAAELLIGALGGRPVACLAADPARLPVLRGALEDAEAPPAVGEWVPHGQSYGRSAPPGDDRRRPPDAPRLAMPASIEAAEGALLAGRVRVEPHPILTWSVATAPIVARPSDRTVRRLDRSGRLTAAIAFVMAVGAAEAAAGADAPPREMAAAEMILQEIY